VVSTLSLSGCFSGTPDAPTASIVDEAELAATLSVECPEPEPEPPPSCDEAIDELPEIDTSRTSVEYWVIRAEPSDAADASELPPVLRGMSETFATPRPTRLSIVEHLQLESIADRRSEVSGHFARVSHRHVMVDGVPVVEFELDLNYGSSELETTVAVEPDVPTLVGRGGDDTRGAPENSQLFYVMRTTEGQGA
jgi:hypothetical protein